MSLQQISQQAPVEMQKQLQKQGWYSVQTLKMAVSQLLNAKRFYVKNISTKNTKQFWRAVKLMNGNGSSTIPVLITMMERQLSVMNRRLAFSTTSSAVVSILPFHLSYWKKKALVN